MTSLVDQLSAAFIQDYGKFLFSGCCLSEKLGIFFSIFLLNFLKEKKTGQASRHWLGNEKKVKLELKQLQYWNPILGGDQTWS